MTPRSDISPATPGNGNSSEREHAWRRDQLALTTARALRGFGAGALSVVLIFELANGGYGPLQIGVALGVAMGAAAAWAILIPGRVRWLSRKGLFVLGAAAVASGGFLLWYDITDPWILIGASLGRSGSRWRRH